jgi:hypothetical protein
MVRSRLGYLLSPAPRVTTVLSHSAEVFLSLLLSTLSRSGFLIMFCHEQYLTQVGFNRMSSDIDDALPVFEKAVKVAGTASTHMNYGFCLMAKVFGVDTAQSSRLPTTPAWAPQLDVAIVEFTAAVACDAGYASPPRSIHCAPTFLAVHASISFLT